MSETRNYNQLVDLFAPLARLERAWRAVEQYIEFYQRYADEVLKQIEQEQPEQLETYRLMRRLAEDDLNALRNRLKVHSNDDVQKIEDVVRGLRKYVLAADYLDDKAAMLTVAVDQLEMILARLELLQDEAVKAAETVAATQPVRGSVAWQTTPYRPTRRIDHAGMKQRDLAVA